MTPPPPEPDAAPAPEAVEAEPPRVDETPGGATASHVADAVPYVVDPRARPQTTGVLHISFAKARELPFGDQLARVFLALPAARPFAADGIELVREIDEVVYASHDLFDPRNTFVVVRHGLGQAEMQEALSRAAERDGSTIEWSEVRGELRGNPRPVDMALPDPDPRLLVVRRDGTVVHALGELIASAEEKARVDTIASFFATTVRQPARSPRAATVLRLELVGHELVRKLHLRFAGPERFVLTIAARDRPEVVMLAMFATTEDARGFEDLWRNSLRSKIDGSLVLRSALRPIYDALVLTRKATRVQVRGRFDAGTIGSLLDGTARFLSSSPTPPEVQQATKSPSSPAHGPAGR